MNDKKEEKKEVQRADIKDDKKPENPSQIQAPKDQFIPRTEGRQRASSIIKPARISDEKEILTAEEISELKEFKAELEREDEEDNENHPPTPEGVKERPVA